MRRYGFPAVIAALASTRADRIAVVELLLDHGADVEQRGINDWTPLHYAAAANDVAAIELLCARGADAMARTRVDDRATPREEAEILGLAEAVRAWAIRRENREDLRKLISLLEAG